ncbi:MAG TPA: polyphosphate:AMP phosphotransferase [Opitutaceae bacterium]|nr:polyphosphate:AMP phosphotransferase [Opitutaceae bacterium]
MARKIATPRIPKKEYEARVPRLRERLIQLQVELKAAPFPVLLVVAGVEGAGRGELINTLNGWLDPRGVETVAFHTPTDEERERPFMWRFWRSLSPRGRMGIFAGSWYTETLREEIHGAKNLTQLDHELHRIRRFEQLLADDGALILKVWLHLSKTAQHKRLHALASDERTAWRVKPDDWHHHRLYDRLGQTARRILDATHRPATPWLIVGADDERSRDLAVGQLLLTRFREHARKIKKAQSQKAKAQGTAAAPLRAAGLRRLLALPLDQQLSAADYEEKRDKWLGRLNHAVRAASAQHRSIVFVFEGWDAAGKGGAIRRLSSAIDARDYRVIPIAKPNDEEKAHHYLWRFWRHVPRAGMVTIYDRSWYGRVLVERLEGFCSEAEWKRAFTEINDFEAQLTERGIIVVKFWMHISKDEQLRRFREREDTAYKRHKIDHEDWRNRRKWHAYEVAVGDMLALTDTTFAPWHLIPANNKRHARLQILKTACKQIETALEGK